MPYHISARAYLARAKQQLLANTNESLFYAAFELRCCVETRQEEYATEIKFIKTKIKPWKIGATAKQLERIFNSNKIARITMTDSNTADFVLYHTPVSQKLYREAEKLGEFLHRMEGFKNDDDHFWSSTRNKIRKIYRDAWYSCQGQMITPPLQNHPFKISDPSEQLKEFLQRAGRDKFTIKTKIEYLDQPPKEWVCDLSP